MSKSGKKTDRDVMQDPRVRFINFEMATKKRLKKLFVVGACPPGTDEAVSKSKSRRGSQS